jgi:hypothetical protein
MKVGDLIKIKPFYKLEGRQGIVTAEWTNYDNVSFFQIIFPDTGETTSITKTAAEIISGS